MSTEVMAAYDTFIKKTVEYLDIGHIYNYIVPVIASLVFFTVIGELSKILTPIIFKSIYNDLSGDLKIDWHVKVITIVYSTWISVKAFPYVLESIYTEKSLTFVSHDLSMICAISLG
jgi:hypothetical protein